MASPSLACSTSGPNLRRLYLPGLEGLKAELRKLDFLLQRFLPNLTAHLNASAPALGCLCLGAFGHLSLHSQQDLWSPALPAALPPSCSPGRQPPAPSLPPSPPLQAAGVVPVLFASQWLLTCYSCPFPVGFACRLVDVMLQARSRRGRGGLACASLHPRPCVPQPELLTSRQPCHPLRHLSSPSAAACPEQENSDAVLLKAAVAILAECEGDLMMQEVGPPRSFSVCAVCVWGGWRGWG